jgi:hypothetical protein
VIRKKGPAMDGRIDKRREEMEKEIESEKV